MKTENIIALFPKEIKVTKKMIEKGSRSIMSSRKCIGAQILKSIVGIKRNSLDSKLNCSWGVCSGHIYNGKDSICIDAMDSDSKLVDVMEIKEERTIILSISECV